MIGPVARLLKLASIVICAIVIASFAVFAIDQTKSASNRQTEQLNTGVVASGNEAARPASHKSGLHKAIDEASGELTSPFSGLLSGSSSEWAIRGTKLLLALLVYGIVSTDTRSWGSAATCRAVKSSPSSVSRCRTLCE